MFSINSFVLIFLLGSYELRAHSLAPANYERSRIFLAGAALSPRDESSYISSTSQTSISQFMSSWETLYQSFSQCQSAFTQDSSIDVAIQSVQQLRSSYQKAFEQYNSCEVCASSLSHSNFETQIQQSVASMFSSFNSIMQTGQQKFGSQWDTHFASAFKSMSQFSSFSKQVCTSAGIDLRNSLSHLSLDEGLFNQMGMNVDGIFGKSGTTSQTSISQFMSSWESLYQSFSQCQSAFTQDSSIDVATESVQQLRSSYQKAVEQYNSCEECATSLSHSSFETQIQQSVTSMYSSFNSIMQTGQQKFGAQWDTHFASAFQSMSQFSSFSKQVCSSAGIDLRNTLSHLNLDEGLFNRIGLNVNGIFGKSGGDSSSNMLGGNMNGDSSDSDASGSLLSGLI